MVFSKSNPPAARVILPEESILNTLLEFPETISKARVPTVSASNTTMSIISVPGKDEKLILLISIVIYVMISGYLVQ